MVTRRVNPPHMKAPPKLLNDPALGPYFQSIDLWMYQMWQRTGAGDDFIGDSVKSVVGGTDISVDSTDGENPIVNFTGEIPPIVDAASFITEETGADKVISVQSADYTTYTSETVILTKDATVKLNATPDDKEVVYIKGGSGTGFLMDGNGKLIDGEKKIQICRPLVGERLVYTIELDAWRRT